MRGAIVLHGVDLTRQNSALSPEGLRQLPPFRLGDDQLDQGEASG